MALCENSPFLWPNTYNDVRKFDLSGNCYCFFLIEWAFTDCIDRPDQTESSATIPKGALQVEAGLQVSIVGEGDFGNSTMVVANQPIPLWRDR